MPTTEKPVWWNVTMAWGGKDEGTYSDSFLAPDDTSARMLCAEAMADGSRGIKTDQERAAFIKARMQGYAEVYRADDQFQRDLVKLFGGVLFGDGPTRQIDLDKLGQVLAANRDVLVQHDVTALPEQSPDQPLRNLTLLQTSESWNDFTLELKRRCEESSNKVLVTLRDGSVANVGYFPADDEEGMIEGFRDRNENSARLWYPSGESFTTSDWDLIALD